MAFGLATGIAAMSSHCWNSRYKEHDLLQQQKYQRPQLFPDMDGELAQSSLHNRQANGGFGFFGVAARTSGSGWANGSFRFRTFPIMVALLRTLQRAAVEFAMRIREFTLCF